MCLVLLVGLPAIIIDLAALLSAQIDFLSLLAFSLCS